MNTSIGLLIIVGSVGLILWFLRRYLNLVTRSATQRDVLQEWQACDRETAEALLAEVPPAAPLSR